MVVEFIEFRTRNYVDYLNLYDGDNEQSDTLGTYEGNDKPPQLISSNNTMFIKFNSFALTNDYSNEGLGYKILYTTVYNKGNLTIEF